MSNTELDLIQGDEALMHFLTPLLPYLEACDISDIRINHGGKMFVVNAKMEKHKIVLPELTASYLETLCQLIATHQHQRVSKEKPLLSASLPLGHRTQVILSPVAANEKGMPALIFRKQIVQDLTLATLCDGGLFDIAKPHRVPFFKNEMRVVNEDEQILAQHFENGDYVAFLKEAILSKKNILFAGATGSGKTTLLNACLKEIPISERIITLEDTRELQLPHDDFLHLLVSKGEQGVSKVTMSDLVETCLRSSPDRIVFGEIRGPEALDFMNASLTGHEGSFVSLHAVNPTAVFIRMANLVQSNPSVQLSRQDILSDLNFLLDVIIQMKNVDTPQGKKKRITEIYSAFNQEVKTC